MNATLCIACTNPTTFFGKKNKYDYARCQKCGTIQLSPLPRSQELEKKYESSTYSSDDSHGQGEADAVRRASKAHYECIRDILKIENISGKILDYGAGWGGLVETLLAAGFDASGIELSQNMVLECQRRGLPVVGGNLSTIEISSGTFDAITLCGVFEHLLNPDIFLNRASSGLKKGGKILTLQPTSAFARLLGNVFRFGIQKRELPGSFFIFDPPWHVALYSLSGMQSLAERNGFKVSNIYPVPQGRFPGVTGLVQAVANPVNKLGWNIAGTSWPLMVSHLIVLEKV